MNIISRLQEMKTCFLFLILLFQIDIVSSQFNFNDMVVSLRCALSGSSQTPKECFDDSVVYTSVIRTVSADCSDLIFKGKCQATVAINEKMGGYFVMQFRGVTGVANFASNMASILGSQTLQPFESYGKVAEHSLIAFNRIWYDAGFGEVMKNLYNNYCDFYIYSEGHGLGSCQAQMAALKLAEFWNPNQIQVYVYGSPRCGNADFAASHDRNVGHQQRILWFNDPIWQYPAGNPSLCDYTKTAADNIGKDCWFHTREVVHMKTFNFDGTIYTYDFCANGENKTCLTVFPLNVPSDHYAYVNTKAVNYDNLVCTTYPWANITW